MSITRSPKVMLGVALGCGLLATLLLRLYMARFEAEATGGAPTAVLTLTRDLEAGARLEATDLGVLKLPADYHESRHVPAAESHRILGLRLRSDRLAHETLLWSDLVGIDGDGRTLSNLVRPGTRAMTVHPSRHALPELARPGDRVDLLCGDATGKVLLENIQLLAVGHDIGQGARGDRGGRARSLTLAVTPEEASQLARSSRCGALLVALRNPDDLVTRRAVTQLEPTP